MPRKVPKQPVHPTVAAGAIVLPTRMKASSGGAIYKIPKSIHGWPDPKLNERRPVFGEPVQTASSASSSSATGKRLKSRERGESGGNSVSNEIGCLLMFFFFVLDTFSIKN